MMENIKKLQKKSTEYSPEVQKLNLDQFKTYPELLLF